jgi:dihydrofolate synthase/folylpolyglutamate synthase
VKPLDFGRSDDPRVQAQLDRLSALSVPQGRLGLDTIRALMERLGNPHRKLPPVFHVAGTNGKGSTCAFLRAMLEAEGYRVHVTTSPHLVRYNERIRLAGELISDAMLADVLEEVLNEGEDLGPSFFEVTIAAAFLAFARVPADACVVEVGMGGRFDATNVLEPEALAACGIAALGLDHERFLLAPEEGVPTEPMARIAFEKAGIAKKGVPLIVRAPDQPEALEAIEDVAEKVDAPLHVGGHAGAWAIKANWRAPEKVRYADWQESSGKQTSFVLPQPSLAGEHQIENAGLAIAMLRHQRRVRVSMKAIDKGLVAAKWPARLQRLAPGPLTGHREVWLDGGHNPNAAQRLFSFLNRHIYADRILATGEVRPIHLIIGMIEGKDPTALTAPLATLLESITAVPVPGHDWHPASAFGTSARAAPDVPSALAKIPDDGLPILIAGSLYLAGEVLRLNDEVPD